MSTINTLKIKGIRSFGVEKDDEQKIEFSSPLTLIVGQNGSGKTTVIECLKYALTGDKPPGTDSGRTFVCDPKIAKIKSAMAQVKLTCTNPRLVEKTVVRSMRSEVLKNGKTKFETLDSTIITIDPAKGRSDLSGRVEDINTNMCQFMGVSRAIINNVIFCHQEDSNWPLDEGKKLKEKFDAIFGTTEYNKAIDKFIKLRKKLQLDLSEQRGIMLVNKEVKSQAEKMERELKSEQRKCEKIEVQLIEANEKLKELEQRKDEILKRESNLAELVNKRNKYKNIIESKSDDYNSLKVKINRRLSGSIEELEQQLRTFQEDQVKKQNEKRKIETNNTELENEQKKCQQEISSSLASINVTRDKIGNMQELSCERFEKMRDICEKLDIPFDELDQSVDTQQVCGTFESVEEKIAKEEENLKKVKDEGLRIDHEYQVQIDKLREEYTKLETEINTISKFIENTKENRNKIKQEIEASEKSIPMLNQLQPKIAAAEKKLDKLKNDGTRIQGLKDSQDIIDFDIIELNDQLAKVDDQIERLHTASTITNELDIAKNNLNKDQKEFERIKNKLTSNLKTIFGKELPDSNYRLKVTKKKENLENEVKSLKDQLNVLQRDYDRNFERRSNLKKQIDQKLSDLKRIQDDIDNVCSGKDFSSYLASLKESVDKHQMELAVLKSSKDTLTDYIEKIKDDPNCPVCHKNLEEHEGDELRNEMEEKIQELPKKIKMAEAKLKKEQVTYEKLNSLKSDYDSIEKLTNEKLKLENDIKKIERDQQENEEKKEVLEAQLIEPQELLNLFTTSFLGDSYKLDDLQKNIGVKVKEVETIAAKLPKDLPEISLADAKEKRKKLSDTIKSKSDESRKISDEIKSHEREFNDAHSVINDLNAQKNKFQEKVQGIERLKEQYKQLESVKSENEQNFKDKQLKLGPIRQQLKKVNDDKQRARDEAHNKQSVLENKLELIKRDKLALDHVISELKKFQDMNLHQTYEDEKKKIKQHKEKLAELEKKQEELKKKLKDIEAYIANEETTYRNIQDNIDLLNIAKAKQEAIDKFNELIKQCGDTDLSKYQKEREVNKIEIQKMNIELGKLSGTLGTLKGSCEKMEAELNEKKYKNATKDYLQSVYKVHTLQVMIDDILKYKNVLEKSLLDFHKDKMEQINLLLREYWNNIYQGNDIDYITIKTDEEDETGKSVAQSEKKRSYNYRVVQSKNGSEVDMRGRCSAGQKVLASLIIRMALADTFSLNCGILALDEPTTNLDSANIRSLCTALARIVQERDDDTGKFMLIVITHDEEFAKALERADHFWSLSRNNKGCSRIEKVNNY